MGLIVVPFHLNAFDIDEDDMKKRTLEVNFAPCSIMAFTSISLVVDLNDDLMIASAGIKRVRQRGSDGVDRTITLGNSYWSWPRAWCGDRISSVTFAFGGMGRVRFDAVCVIHTW